MPPKYLLRAGLVSAVLCGVSPSHAADAPSVAPASANIQVVEMIVAKVNGEIITQTELEHQRELIASELHKNDPSLSGMALESKVKEKQSDALRDQIDQLLLVAKAKDLNINVDPEITRRIAQVQAENKKLDPEEFHKFVEEQTGIPFEDFRNQMKNTMLTQKVIGQEVAYKIQIPSSELKDYYEKHKSEFVRQEQVFLREILIAPKSNSPEDIAAAEKKAKDIAARARKGEKFGDLARSYSDATSAQQEGELPAYKRGDLRKEIEDQVYKANKGYVTDPIRSSTGFVILKVEDRYEAGQASFEDVQAEIQERLFAPRMQPEIRKYLTQLRADAFIEIRGGYTDSGAAPGKDTSWKDPAVLKPQTITKEEVAAKKKKRIMGVIPRFGGDKVSSSNPGDAPKMPSSTASSAKPDAGSTTPAAAPAAPASGSSLSSTTPNP